METELLESFKKALREIADDPKHFIPDQESYELLHKLVPWPASEVCLVNDRGELLLHYREFTEWPGKFGEIKGWYIPGGYIKAGKMLQEWCQFHLEKDGVVADIEFIDTAGVLLWNAGEHPFGNPLSIVCVCKLIGAPSFREGDEGNFKWVDKKLETLVPNHTRLQDIFFKWKQEHPEFFS